MDRWLKAGGVKKNIVSLMRNETLKFLATTSALSITAGEAMTTDSSCTFYSLKQNVDTRNKAGFISMRQNYDKNT